MPLYSYTCKAGHSQDALGAVGSPSSRLCPECGLNAERDSIYQMHTIGEANVPNDQKEVSLKDYKEATAELEYNHNKLQDKVGAEIAPPPIWKASQAGARELESKGVTDSSQFRGTGYGEMKYRTRWLRTTEEKKD